MYFICDIYKLQNIKQFGRCYLMNEEKEKSGFMVKVATFIVDKRKAFYLIFVAALIYSILSMSRVLVNNDITSYLPEDSETRIGINIMNEQFKTFGSARVMITNVTKEKAEELQHKIEEIDGVFSVTFADEDTEENKNYKGTYALINVAFEDEASEDRAKNAMIEIKKLLEPYDTYIQSEVGNDFAASLAKDMQIILVLAAIVIVTVLLLTSKTYMEIPVFIMVFGTAAILNKGTNFWFGEISFVTDSIAVILQLALAIDYAIILCHRYMEEHETKDSREATIIALSKAIPEIASSSLTTVSGMVAMMFMQFRIGFDMGIVLTKSIIFSLLTVFLLMPGLLMMFAKLIDKTHHKNFVPRISFVGKFAYYTRFVIPPLFIVIIILSFIFQSKCVYIYDMGSINTKNKTEQKLAEEKIDDAFGSNNVLAVIFPKGSYEKESKMVEELEKLDYIESILSLTNVEVKDGYMLTDKLNPRQFSEISGLDIEIAKMMYGAYAVNIGQYGPVVSGLDDYKVPILDMFMFLYDQKQEGYVELDKELNEELDDLYRQLRNGQQQLQGTTKSRVVLNMNLPIEGTETFKELDNIKSIARKYYGNDVVLAGNSTSNKDLEASFVTDNTVITVLTALFVMAILLFTFQSAGLPVLLVLAIQGSIWINFSFPYITNDTLFFMSSLIVSAIQMGATIDYAIVITSRYMDLKSYMPIKEAMIESLNQAFPTIFTSGTILTSAGFIIGNLSHDPTVSSIGTSLGRGTLISIIIVLFILPQILLLGDIIIQKTAFTLHREFALPLPTGKIRVNGHIRGTIIGSIDADVNGILIGDIKANVETRNHESHFEKLDDISLPIFNEAKQEKNETEVEVLENANEGDEEYEKQ